VHPPPPPASADFSTMMECTPEIGNRRTVCTLWCFPRATSSKGRIVQGTEHPRLFCFGTHRSGTLSKAIKKYRRNEYLERGLQFLLLLVKKMTKMSHYKA
jgi:hypothetical protein